MTTGIARNISFHFRQYDFENSGHAVYKDTGNGFKRRYLIGVSSGLNTDAHGERMSEKAIKSFLEQANAGEILLYPDVHGIKDSEDIGILTKAEILENGDWYTEYRLYDEYDEVGPSKLEKIDTIWKQMNGLPPYGKPRQKGFSIEGSIPEESVLYGETENLKQGILDAVNLDGVVLVSKPAYQDSIATSIYKALGQTTPGRKKSLQESLTQNIEEEEEEENYYRLKWKIHDALESSIERVMRKNNNNKEQELNILFDEYKVILTDLILKSERIFAGEHDDSEDIDESQQIGKEASKLDVLKSLSVELKKYKKILEDKNV